MNIDILLSFIEKAQIKKATFEKKVGLSNGYLANMKKSNSEIQPEKLSLIYAQYPELKALIEQGEKDAVSNAYRELNTEIHPADADTAYERAVKLKGLTESVTGIKEDGPPIYDFASLLAEFKKLREQVRVSLDYASAEVETVSLQNRVLLSLLQEIAAAATDVPLAQWVQTTNKIKASVLDVSENKGKS